MSENSQKKLLLYLISDASGETVNITASAASSQFGGVEIYKHLRPLTRTNTQVNHIIKEIQEAVKREKEIVVLVIYTMAKGPILDQLLSQCKENNIPIISPIEKITQEISNLLHLLPNINQPSKYQLNDEYYSLIDDLNFAIHHDDGQNRHNYSSADIVLIGTSRSSKSPTSLYLSRLGYKVANIPYIPEMEPDISDLSDVIKIGLIISPSSLSSIREKRRENALDPNNNCRNSLYKNYSSFEQAREEITRANHFFLRHKIPIVNVTRKAIEEISAEIINIVRKTRGECK